MSELLVEVLRDGIRKQKFTVQAFVVMPEHLHAVLTPNRLLSLERAVQFIKGTFSYRAKCELGIGMEIWQASFTNHRIRNEGDFKRHLEYIITNPVKAGLPDSHQFVYPKPGAQAHSLTDGDSLG
jgi:putative transposase